MIEKKYTKIYFRVLPMEEMTWEHVKIFNDQKTLHIRCLQELAKPKKGAPSFWTFHTDHVFFRHSQNEIYNTIVPEVLDNISHGHDALIMAYGQTGTGKSLTINGLYSSYQDRGILPRLASDLFNKVKAEAAKTHTKLSIQVSYVEFARNTTNDLLKPFPNHLCQLKDMSKSKVKSFEEVLQIIFKGEGRKEWSNNSSYVSQSFSSIFTFHIRIKNVGVQDDLSKKCKLHIIDLAGADTVGNFTCVFKRPQEVGTANLAKTQLEQFFLVLSSDIPAHIKIKQRLSPMIHYLGDSLKKTTILRFIGHIRASREDLLITISMLRFGDLIRGLKATRYELNVEKGSSEERLNALQKELNRIQLENKYNAILMRQDLAKSLNRDRYAHIERTVKEYLQNKITHLTLLNVCDINIALETLKSIYEKQEEEKMPEKVSVSRPARLSSSSSHKVQQKSSRSSSKISRKKSNGEKFSETTVTGGTPKSPKESSLQNVSKEKKRPSSSSLLKKRSSTGRRKSTSTASIREVPSGENVMKIHVPPEHSQAWDSYIHERHDEYTTIQDSYKTNEAAAKDAYRRYLREVENLRDINARIEKQRNDLFLVKMTREYQQAVQCGMMLSEYEDCCKKKLQTAEQEYRDKQEWVLTCQAEIKAHMNVCKEQKKALDDGFNEFCQEKYEVPVVAESSEATAMNIEKVLQQEEVKVEEQSEPKNPEEEMFENFKELIEIEKNKKSVYQLKHREWLTN